MVGGGGSFSGDFFRFSHMYNLDILPSYTLQPGHASVIRVNFLSKIDLIEADEPANI